MISAVDTNILIDILEPDPTFGESSKTALKECLRQGHVVACEIVWAEVSTAYQNNVRGLLDILEEIGIGFSPITQNTALVAAHEWYEYRRNGGNRRRIAADFLIGAHAITQTAGLQRRRIAGARRQAVDQPLGCAT